MHPPGHVKEPRHLPQGLDDQAEEPNRCDHLPDDFQTDRLENLDQKHHDREHHDPAVKHRRHRIQPEQNPVLLRQEAAKLKLDVANEKATNDAEVRVARAIVELAKAEYEESIAINKSSGGSAIPPTQLRRQRVQWEKAALDCVAADMSLKIAGLERNVSEAEVEAVDNELERRTLRAPFDGVVVEVYRHQSEWVQPGEPVFRFVRMDRLRIDGFVSAREVLPGQVDGANVEITVALPGGMQQKLSGKIGYVSPQVGSNRDYRIWAEVDNLPGRDGYPWLLRPGTTAGMVIRLNPVADMAGR
jgi:multidrug efflux pump subunit AcrA (membrane-fusion protein)